MVDPLVQPQVTLVHDLLWIKSIDLIQKNPACINSDKLNCTTQLS